MSDLERLAQWMISESLSTGHGDDLNGGDALITGRCWDKLRRVMDEAAQTLEVLEETPWLGEAPR